MKRPWVQFWSLSIAVCYPLAWLAAAVVLSAPRLVAALMRGDRLTQLRPEYLGFTFAVQGGGAPGALPISMAILCIAALPALALRKGILSGLWLGLLGNLGLLPALMPLFRNGRLTAGAVLAILLCLALLAAGLRRMLAPLAAASYLGRVGFLAAAFVLPIALVPLVYFRGLPFALRLFWIPSLAAALAVSAVPMRPREWHKPGWRPVVAGFIVTLMLIAAVEQSRAAFVRQQRSLNQAAMAGIAGPTAAAPYPKLFFQHGVNFTAEGPTGYSPEACKPLLAALRERGVDAIALVPYAFTPHNTPEVRFGDGWETDESIEQVAALAHHLGMKVLLKPQVWVGNGYPGDLEFTNPAARDQWFEKYQRYIEHHAALAKRIHADLFCTGVEFVKLAQFEAHWRKLIARARQIYPGPLVYAATQGPEFEGIRFWDALDYIGLNNYYPLPDDLQTRAVVERVAAVQRRFQKPVIFTEVGFSAYENPHRQPWDETRRKVSMADQARCYEAVFQAFYRQPWFMGMYWWKIGTNGHGGELDGSFTPWRKPAMDVVSRWYRGGVR